MANTPMAETSGPARRDGAPVDRLLQQALRGDRIALVEFCQRTKVYIFAVALNAGLPWKEAATSVGPHLRLLCTKLLDGHWQPVDWKHELTAQVRTAAQMDRDLGSANEPPGLSGLAAIPRLARRRAVRETLLQLSLPQLTGVLLRQIDDACAADMVGLVADSEDAVRELLVSAEDAITRALREVRQRLAERDDM